MLFFWLLSTYIWSATKDFSAINFACKSLVLTCAKLLEFWETVWGSGDRFADFAVIGVSLGKFNGFSVLGIGMEITDVQNDKMEIAGVKLVKYTKKIMKRTILRNKFTDSKTDTDRIAYNKQRNYCVTRLRKEKRPISVILKYVT